MIVDELKDSILESAIRGTLVYNSKDNASELLQKMIEKKEIYLKENKLQNNKTGVSKNKKFILPSNWVWTSIGEVCFVTKLAGFEYTKYMAPNLSSVGDVPIVRARNIKPNCFIDNCEEYISSELSDTLYRCALNEKCTLMTFIGAGIGEVAIFDKDTRYHLAPNVAKIVPSLDINKYLMYYLMSPTGRKNIFQYKKQTAQPSLSMETIRNVILPLPPIEEQQRIVNKIEKLFAKLDEIKPIEQELIEIKSKFGSDMRDSILFYAMQGKLTEQNKDETIRISINNKFKIVAPYTIPDNWKSLSHNDLFEIVGGSQPPKSKFSDKKLEGFIQLYQTRDYGPNPQPVYVDKNDVSKFSNKDDIILARYGGSLGKVFWAEDGAYNVALAKVVIKYPECINKKFLYYYYLSDLYQSKVKNGNRSAQAGFSKEDLNDLFFPLPPIEEQQRIVDKIEELLPLCDDIEKLVSK